jgi:beta-glucosidase
MLHPNIAVREDGVIPDQPTPVQVPAGFGGLAPGQVPRNAPPPKVYIAERHIRNVLNNGVAEPSTFAKWSNGMQEMAEATRLGIPIMFSSDPRHGATLGAHVRGAQYFSQWPSREGQFGLAASRDVELARDLGKVTAEEYRAVGLHMNLGPQIDLPTEPRWGRNAGAFSEDAQLTAEMAVAYLQGAQGEKIGPTSIIAMLKHWPGSGPHKGGLCGGRHNGHGLLQRNAVR